MDTSGEQHEKYAELCAIFTTGSLTGSDLRDLRVHLESCQSCCQLLSDYRHIVNEGIPSVFSESLSEDAIGISSRSVRVETRKLFARIASGNLPANVPYVPRTPPKRALSVPNFFRTVPFAYASAGLVAVLLLVAGYLVGARRHESDRPVASPTMETGGRSSGKRENEQKVRSDFEAAFRVKESEIGSLRARIDSESKEIKHLQRLVDEAATARDASNSENSRLAMEHTDLLRHREDMEQGTRRAQASLASVQQELDQLRAEREKDLAQSADLQNQVAALVSEAASREQMISEQRKLLDSDKDIRDLMGARELYIADVYDVDSDDRTPKPFGRVFYTKQKSLIFYAFDLDEQAGVRAAKTFQAWGLRDGDKDHPLSMGVFYKDNEINRRWVLKFEDPRVLDQIQAVFVTVEPKGGSRKPSGRQLLYASLRMAPNHP